MQRLPKSDADLQDFIQDIADTYKRSSQIREALRHSWAGLSPNYRVPDLKSGNTALHMAAKLGEVKVVTALGHIDQAEVSIKNYDGNTPLHLAAEFDRPAVVEALLKHKADLHAVNNDGFVPVQVAAIQLHKVIMNEFKIEAKFNWSLFRIVLRVCSNMVPALWN